MRVRVSSISARLPRKLRVQTPPASSAKTTVRGDRAPHRPAIAPLDPIVGRHQPGLAEDHAVEEPGQEERPPGAGARPDRLPADAEGFRHPHHQPVDRRALLRAGGEVDAAQHVALFVPVVDEHLGEEPARDIAHARHLAREALDQRPALVVGLGLHPLQKLGVQLSEKRRELVVELRHRRGFAAGAVERQGKAPDLLALVLAEVVEILGEAGDQVGLGEGDVDRKPHAQPLAEFVEPPPHRLGMRHLRRLVLQRQVRQRDRHDGAVDRLPLRCFFNSARNPNQPAVSVAASLSCVV